jgi:hypothetical protein
MKHPGELTLRRHLAEETLDASMLEHLGACTDCQERLSALREEQAAFENEIPFERFAAGVASKVPSGLSERVEDGPTEAGRERSSGRSLDELGTGSDRPGWWALAAGIVVLSGVGLVLRTQEPATRIKGGGTVDFVVNGPSGQRDAAETEQLAIGERLRIGVSGHRHVLALSIDDAGEVSTMYSEALGSEAQTWLPDSIEFTGQGREYVVVLLSDAPVPEEDAARKLGEAFKAAEGDLSRMGSIDLPGVQVHRTFIKP